MTVDQCETQHKDGKTLIGVYLGTHLCALVSCHAQLPVGRNRASSVACSRWSISDASHNLLAMGGCSVHPNHISLANNSILDRTLLHAAGSTLTIRTLTTASHQPAHSFARAPLSARTGRRRVCPSQPTATSLGRSRGYRTVHRSRWRACLRRTDRAARVHHSFATGHGTTTHRESSGLTRFHRSTNACAD